MSNLIAGPGFDESIITEDLLAELQAEGAQARKELDDFKLFDDQPKTSKPFSLPKDGEDDVINYDKLTGTEDLLEDIRSNALVVRLAILARHIRKDPTSWHLYQTQVMLGLDEKIEKNMGSPSVFATFRAIPDDTDDEIAVAAVAEILHNENRLKLVAQSHENTIDKMVAALPNAAPHVHPNILQRDRIFNVFGDIQPLSLNNYAGIYKLQTVPKPDPLVLSYATETGVLTLDTCTVKPLLFRLLEYEKLKIHPAATRFKKEKKFEHIVKSGYYQVVFTVPSSDSARFREFMTNRNFPYIRHLVKKSRMQKEHVFFKRDFDVSLKKKLFLDDLANFRKDLRRHNASHVHDYLLSVPGKTINILNWFAGKNIDGTPLCENYKQKFYNKSLLPQGVSYNENKFCMMGPQNCGCFACPREMFLGLQIPTKYVFELQNDLKVTRLIPAGNGKECIICGAYYTGKFCDGYQHQHMVDVYRKKLEHNYGCVITSAKIKQVTCEFCPLRMVIDPDFTGGIAVIASNEIRVSVNFDLYTSLWISILDEYDHIFYTCHNQAAYREFKHKYINSINERAINFIQYDPTKHGSMAICTEQRCYRVQKMLENKGCADILANDISHTHFPEAFERSVAKTKVPPVFMLGGQIYRDYINMKSRNIARDGSTTTEEDITVKPSVFINKKRLNDVINETDDNDYDPIDELLDLSETSIAQKKVKKE